MNWLILIFISLTMAQEHTLKFKNDETFKILLFADLHDDNPEQTCNDITKQQQVYNCTNQNTTDFVANIIKFENPDLIAFLGDSVDWDAKNTTNSSHYVFGPAIESGIPWTAILGNHDGQGSLNRSETMKVYTELPNSLASMGPSDINGYGNYYIKIRSEKYNPFVLWFFDSGDESQVPSIPGYDWIHTDQINWYSKNKYSKNNGLAFFHIPIPEYNTVVETKSACKKIVGNYQESVCCPNVNSGLFTALLANGGVKATFCGHDHTNDYCGNLYGLNLCYTGGSSMVGYGKAGWPRRTRVIELRDQGHEILTWKRLHTPTFDQIDVQQLYP